MDGSVATPTSGAAVSPTGETSGADNITPASIDWSKVPQAEIDKLVEGHKTKLKINGQDRELSYSEMKKLASLAEASDQKFKSAKALSEEAFQTKRAFESGDPVEALKRLGKTSKEIKQILEDKWVELAEEENLDPRERELRELRAEKESARKTKEQEEASRKESDQKVEVTRMQDKLESELGEALTAAKLPRNPFIAKLVIQEMIGADQMGYELSPKDAVNLVSKKLPEMVSGILSLVGPDQVKALLGDKLVKSLMGESVREVKQAQAPFPQRNPLQNKPAESQESGQIDMNDFFRNRKRQKGV